jgi:hypothetical protein
MKTHGLKAQQLHGGLVAQKKKKTIGQMQSGNMTAVLVQTPAQRNDAPVIGMHPESLLTEAPISNDAYFHNDDDDDFGPPTVTQPA